MDDIRAATDKAKSPGAKLDAFQRRGDLLAVGTWADPREGSMAVFRTRTAAEEFVKAAREVSVNCM